jgi:hypothetical protein
MIEMLRIYLKGFFENVTIEELPPPAFPLKEIPKPMILRTPS